MEFVLRALQAQIVFTTISRKTHLHLSEGTRTLTRASQCMPALPQGICLDARGRSSRNSEVPSSFQGLYPLHSPQRQSLVNTHPNNSLQSQPTQLCSPLRQLGERKAVLHQPLWVSFPSSSQKQRDHERLESPSF